MREYSNKFKVCAVSSNTNSFGLYQFVIIARNGEAYKAHASYYNVPKKGDELFVPIITDKEGNVVGHNLSKLGYEMPSKLDKAPKEVVNECWNN